MITSFKRTFFYKKKKGGEKVLLLKNNEGKVGAKTKAKGDRSGWNQRRNSPVNCYSSRIFSTYEATRTHVYCC